jgi:hypothetical protein
MAASIKLTVHDRVLIFQSTLLLKIFVKLTFFYLLGFLKRNRAKIFNLPVYCESIVIMCFCRSQWPCGRRRGSTAARVVGLQVRISPGAWMFVCCALSSVGLRVGLITRPEESYRVWCVWVWSWSLDNEGGVGLLVAVTPWKTIIHYRWPVCCCLSSWQRIMIAFWSVGMVAFAL